MECSVINDLFTPYIYFLDLSPSEATIAGGSTITLTCSLNHSLGRYSSRDLYWNLNNITVSSEYINIIDDTSASYTLRAGHSNVTLYDSVACGLNDTAAVASSIIRINGKFDFFIICDLFA